MKKRITIWYIIKKTTDFLVPNWLFNWLKKHPFLPLIIVLLLYVGNAILTRTNIFPIPCISIFGTKCIQHEQTAERPFRGGY